MNHLLKGFLAILLIGLVACTNDQLAPPAVSITVSDFTATIEENPTNGTLIGNLNAQSAEPLTFQIIEQNPSGALAIDVQGNLSVASAALFVFSQNPLITATIEVSNSLESQEVDILIQVTQAGGTGTFTIWTGPKLTFTKSSGSDPSAAANQDRITDRVWLTRANSGGELYNAVSESGQVKGVSPVGTEWALGTTSNLASLTFAPLRRTLRPAALTGQNLVLHLIEEDIYIDVTFLSWSQGGKQGNSGGFSYERSTPN